MAETTAVLKELRDRCEVVPGVTPFMLLQAKALNLITDCAGVRPSGDLKAPLGVVIYCR